MDDKIKAFKENIPKVILREATLFLVVWVSYYFDYLEISKEFITNLLNLSLILSCAMVTIQFYYSISPNTKVIPFKKEFPNVIRFSLLMLGLSAISLFKTIILLK